MGLRDSLASVDYLRALRIIKRGTWLDARSAIRFGVPNFAVDPSQLFGIEATDDAGRVQIVALDEEPLTLQPNARIEDVTSVDLLLEH